MPRWLWWMVALFAIHLFIDQFRTFVFTDNSKGRGLLLLAADQLAHVISLVLLSVWATGENAGALRDIFSGVLTPANLRMFIIGMVILAVWIAPIVEIEVIVALASFKNNAGKGVAPIGLDDRLMGGTERVLALVLIFAGWGWLVPVLFLPRGFWLWRNKAQRSALIPKMLTSIVFTVLLAALMVQIL